ncbi:MULTISPECIES: RNA polymerase sigma factor [Novosphingobium]|uniref:RNA polymerase sigma factor n=1 Tax=Novosphingobium mangrovi (ex Huang et al. 2023) TaxID=2976432 RepID=A0ABT2I7W1_9SPHN|nr:MULTISPECIES: RNA polymerase sigma factor [Novosphingobium]MCT2400899.1 RNA polymerase sigma factor [Novosphingobium mangrovi (ex Huang et al. 2023)]CCA93218.1 RNA polymerase ECF-type sigma factor [Novosphingobium sp. PP1Y]
MFEDCDSEDRRLIVAARAGDRSAFDRLVADHASRLLGLSLRMLGEKSDAEDAVQNALSSAWLALYRFDQTKPVAPWLTTITINKCRDIMRRRRISRLLRFEAEDDANSIAHPDPHQEERLIIRQNLEFLQREIVRLPPKLKEPFILVVFDGRSHEEAAKILGISRKAVETRIYRARNFLREKFEII